MSVYNRGSDWTWRWELSTCVIPVGIAEGYIRGHLSAVQLRPFLKSKPVLENHVHACCGTERENALPWIM